jgi:hypothetical protein
MSRKTHLVGAWPGFSAAHAMDTAMTRLGPHLLRLSDGETGERSGWIQMLIDRSRANPDVEVSVEGAYTDYDDTIQFRVREGHRLRPEEIRLGYYHAFADSYPDFRALRERHGLPALAFQVGLPGPLDLAGNTFGFEAVQADPTLVDAYIAATAREVAAIFTTAPTDVIFQIETVFCMVGVARAPAEAQPAVAEQMAGIIAAVAAAAPGGARFGAHLCLGDFHHKAIMQMGSARPIVLLINALARKWPQGRTLEYVHVPFAAAANPGPLDPAFYERLRELDIPAEIRLAAGFVHEHLDLDDLRRQLKLIEGNAGREVDIAATCGLGRRESPEEAWDAMDKTVALIEGTASGE